jgi:hypothetical protein
MRRHDVLVSVHFHSINFCFVIGTVFCYKIFSIYIGKRETHAYNLVVNLFAKILENLVVRKTKCAKDATIIICGY